MVGGPGGQILRVDLTTGDCLRDQLDPELLHKTVGGRGLGVALLREYAGKDPFGPEMPLVFSTGPLCATAVPMTTRSVVTGRSPLTGTIFSSSCGSPFARHLKGAGCAALVITGASSQPCLLEISSEYARVVPARELWGSGTHAVMQRLSDAGGVAAIGPAGENRVPCASIETAAGESFGRGGLGAVMGSKGLKAIAVQGDADTPVADLPAFNKAVEDLMRLFRASPFLLGPFGIREHGTVNLVDLLVTRGMLPGHNFRSFSNDHTRWNAAALRTTFGGQSGGCYDCSVACKRLLPDGLALPGYDELAAFGGLCGMSELSGIVAACHQCTDLGLDPVSIAGTLAVWFEITGQQLSRPALKRMLVEVAQRTGQGALVALGAASLADDLGQPEQAMTVKGMELPPYDPRASTGLALACAVAPHGASYLTAWPIASEILRKPVPTDRFSFDGKARVIAMAEDANAAADSLVLCRFACAAVELEEMAALLSAVTGEEYSPADLLAAGRRTVAQERAFNGSCGFSVIDDTLPERFFVEQANGLQPINHHRFEQEVAAYHRIREQQTP